MYPSLITLIAQNPTSNISPNSSGSNLLNNTISSSSSLNTNPIASTLSSSNHTDLVLFSTLLSNNISSTVVTPVQKATQPNHDPLLSQNIPTANTGLITTPTPTATTLNTSSPVVPTNNPGTTAPPTTAHDVNNPTLTTSPPAPTSATIPEAKNAAISPPNNNIGESRVIQNTGNAIKSDDSLNQPIQSIIARIANKTQNLPIANKPVATPNQQNTSVPTAALPKDSSVNITNSNEVVKNIVTHPNPTTKSTELSQQSHNVRTTVPVEKQQEGSENKLVSVARRTNPGQNTDKTPNVLATNNNISSTNNLSSTNNQPLVSANNTLLVQNSEIQSFTGESRAADISSPQNILVSGEHKIAALKTDQIYTQNSEAKSYPTASEQVSVKIANAVKAGDTKISIQLEPQNLGKVEVRIDLSHDGRANLVVLADKIETLDLLQKDGRSLEKALQEAGLKTDSGSLNFNLKNNLSTNNNDSNFQQKLKNEQGVESNIEAPDDNNASIIYHSNKALDIRV